MLVFLQIFKTSIFQTVVRMTYLDSSFHDSMFRCLLSWSTFSSCLIHPLSFIFIIQVAIIGTNFDDSTVAYMTCDKGNTVHYYTVEECRKDAIALKTESGRISLSLSVVPFPTTFGPNNLVLLCDCKVNTIPSLHYDTILWLSSADWCIT